MKEYLLCLHSAQDLLAEISHKIKLFDGLVEPLNYYFNEAENEGENVGAEWDELETKFKTVLNEMTRTYYHLSD